MQLSKKNGVIGGRREREVTVMRKSMRASVYLGAIQSSLVNSNNRNTCSTSNYQWFKSKGVSHLTVYTPNICFVHYLSQCMRFFKNMVCATSKASDQPAHTRCLIRAFASRLK